MFTVVLTGGIASGKTTVSDHFAALGVPVVDTDHIAREIVAPGQPALQEIAEVFGPEFLTADGHLDRHRLRQAIFSDPVSKQRLESILHPVIAKVGLHQVQAVAGPYCILVVPLYAESARWAWVDRILVVDVDEKLQIERLTVRDKVGQVEAKAILAAQASRQQRLKLADDVIVNNGSLSELRDQVNRLHKEYLALARQHDKGRCDELV